MKLLSAKSASEIKNISNYCTDPERAYLRMLSCIKAAEVYICKIVTRNMYNKLIRLGVGTNEVVATANKVIRIKNKRLVEREIIRIMKMRRTNVEREIKQCKHEWFKAKSAVNQYLKTKKIRKKYYRVEKNHKQFVWDTKTGSSRKKITFLKDKRSQGNHRGTEMNQDTNRAAMEDREEKEYVGRNGRFFLVTDEDLQREGPTTECKNYEVYGNIILSEYEKDCLSLGPKYMVTPRLEREDFEVEVEAECVKTRLEIKDREEAKDENGEVIEEDLERIREEDRKSRQIFDQEKGELSMSKLRVTDAKYNTRSFPPREAKNEAEILIQARRQNVLATFDEYTQKIPNRGNKLNNINLTREQTQGKKSLLKRSREGELVVTTTDKSGKFAIVETSLYKEAASKHLNDEEITLTEVEDTETLMNRHALQIVKSLKMGTRHGKEGQEERIRKAFRSVGAQPGPVQFLVKDHKKMKEGEKMPPTRQVCSAKGGPSSRLSNLISTILNRAADSMRSDTECQSTEELKKEILDTNRKVERKCEMDPEYSQRIQKAEIISLDVKALYPSLKVNEVKKIVEEMLYKVQEEGNLIFNDVDFHEVGKYLAITCTEEEIIENGLKEVIPKRTASNRGPKPGPAYWESDFRDTYENGKRQEVIKWYKAKNPNKKEEQKMITLMVVKAIEVVMKNHTYRFDGKIYKQKDGGPIGDEMSQAVARVVMIWFDDKFAEKCKEEKVEIILYKRYVDDGNMMVVPPEREDEGNRDTTETVKNGKRTGELCKSIADTISEMLQFEDDVGENYVDGKLPILDLKVWIEKTNGGAKIKHQFYKKPMSSKYTLKKDTAYPKNRIRAVMVEEVMRRLRNCSPEMSWEEKGKFITEFAMEMKNSGHTEEFRKEVTDRAITKYKKELLAHNKGDKDLYRNRQEREKEQEQKGGKARKDSWFRKTSSKDEKKTTSTLRVPYTGGTLKREMDKTLKSSKTPEGTLTVAHEDSGEKLHHLLIKPDPFPRTKCGRASCKTVVDTATEECRGTCWQQHVNYTIFCKRCEEEKSKENNAEDKKSYVYIGESSRGCFTRFEGHIKKSKSKEKDKDKEKEKGFTKKSKSKEKDKDKEKEEGFMLKHILEKHGGDMTNEFLIKREKVDKDPMRRILRESIRIEHAERDNTKVIMNSKEEHFGTQTIRANFSKDRF